MKEMLKAVLREIGKKPEPLAIPDIGADLRSSEYRRFLRSVMQRKRKTLVEKICRIAPPLGVDVPKKEEVEEYIILSRLDIETRRLMSATILSFLLSILLSFLLSRIGLPLPLLLPLAFLAPYYIYSYPKFRFRVLKTRAQDESIRIILLLSVYLRYSPNLEGAFAFVSANSDGPISEDFRRIMWDLEAGRHARLLDAVKEYSKHWIKWDVDFVRSLNMIINSLTKLSEKEREKDIEDALRNILVNTHMKMRMYSEEVRPKVAILHLGGILLPIMGLLMFPMVSIFLSESINTWYVAFGYIVFLPLLLMWFVWRILSTRPGVYAGPDVSLHPDSPPKGYFLVKIDNERFYVPVLPIAVLVFLLVSLPGILHFGNLGINYLLAREEKRMEIMKGEADVFTFQCLVRWMEEGSLESRPDCQRGLENLIASLSVTVGLALGYFTYLHLSSFQKARLSDMVRELEDEFKVGMFMLANFLSNGMPVEVVIRRTIQQYENLGIESTHMKEFLQRIDRMMREQSKTFEMALSDEGIISNYPSPLIREVLKILKESVKKSPAIAGMTIKTIVKYVDNLKDVEIKIREALEEVRSSLRMQATVITPIITGSVSSLSIFIINILKGIGGQIDEIVENIGFGLKGKNIFGTFIGEFSRIVPFTILQIIVGTYLIEIISIMTFLLSGIDYGFDDALRMRMTASNILQGLIVYLVTVVGSLLVFGAITPLVTGA